MTFTPTDGQTTETVRFFYSHVFRGPATDTTTEIRLSVLQNKVHTALGPLAIYKVSETGVMMTLAEGPVAITEQPVVATPCRGAPASMRCWIKEAKVKMILLELVILQVASDTRTRQPYYEAQQLGQNCEPAPAAIQKRDTTPIVREAIR